MGEVKPGDKEHKQVMIPREGANEEYYNGKFEMPKSKYLIHFTLFVSTLLFV